MIVFRTATVWAQPSPIALAPVVPVPAVTAPAMPVPQQTSRVPGQKYIEEVWDELESATFATPTFKELGTLHEGYSFEELWELARTANPSIRQKENLITAASGGRIQAGLYPNPTLIYSGDNLNVHGEVGKHGLAVSQEIVTAKKKKLDRAVASYDVAAARREYSMECLKLQNDLQIAHYEMLHAILVCKVEEFAQQISTDILEVATLLQAERKSQSADVLQFRTMLHTSALSCKQAKNNRLATWQRLVSIMGLPDLPYQPVRGSLITHSPPRNWQTTWTQFQQTSPQLALAQLKVVQAKTYLARQEAEQTSNVFATFSLARDIPAKTTVPFVGVSVPLKIYNKNQGNIIKARAEVAAARREVERVTLSLHQQLAKVFCDYDNAREQIRVYETSVIPDSFEALRQIAEFYCNGKITCLELYTQRQVVVTALLHYINALKTQAIATVRIDGMLLEGILE
ncbi:MAG: TolC family protein [Planctomycetaceae bacterium]|nr:TolC family protein [Planctomycetaceae bacterium]